MRRKVGIPEKANIEITADEVVFKPEKDLLIIKDSFNFPVKILIKNPNEEILLSILVCKKP